jgi:hypothetical protein
LAIKHGSATAESFAAAREKLVARPGQEGFAQAVGIAGSFDRSFHAPYTDVRIRRFMFRFSWKELNRPRQKMPAVLGFGDEFRRVPIYRRNDNLQCGSGVREHMARMLSNPAINKRGRKSAAGLYKDFLEG